MHSYKCCYYHCYYSYLQLLLLLYISHLCSEEQYQTDVEALITKGADDYNKLKIDLEMNIQALKQQLEEIRATYQLNTEKLDYNYRVLTELDVEKNAELARWVWCG